MVVPITIRIYIQLHVSPTITSNATILHPCKQQQIASGNKIERRQVKKSFDLKIRNIGIVKKGKETRCEPPHESEA